MSNNESQNKSHNVYNHSEEIEKEKRDFFNVIESLSSSIWKEHISRLNPKDLSNEKRGELEYHKKELTAVGEWIEEGSSNIQDCINSILNILATEDALEMNKEKNMGFIGP